MWLCLYAALVAASSLCPWPGRSAPLKSVSVPAMADAGPVPNRTMTVSYVEWASGGGGPSVPVILIHGSPGAADNFDRLGPSLAVPGRRVLAPDLPGFGGSDADPPSMSILAHARAVLAFMDALDIQRAHVVGWSLGGGVALHMTDLAPDRVASLTLMASVGDQTDEGSGSYAFEHLRYAVGAVLVAGVRYLTPHFGVFDAPTRFLSESMRNFWDSDQRPLRAIMQRLETPTLVLHGRHDFLVSSRAAEHHHRLIGPSRLVVLDASHFLPFIQYETTAAHLIPFLERHDSPGVPAIRQAVDLAPSPPPPFGPVGAAAASAARLTPWWAWLMVIAGAAWRRDRLGAALAMLLVAGGLLDYGVALAGVLVGQMLTIAVEARAARPLGAGAVIGAGLSARTLEQWAELLDRRPLRTAAAARFIPGELPAAVRAWRAGRRVCPRFVIGLLVAAIAWALLFMIAVAVVYRFAAQPLAVFGPIPFVAGCLLAMAAPRVFGLVFTRTGRRMLGISVARAVRREFWPTSVLYAPLVPHFLRLAARHRHPLAFTAANPGIAAGGGVVGESKKAILDAMRHPAVLPAAHVPAHGDPARRAELALEAIAARPELGGLPVVLKPDAGQRGFGVRLARTEDDIRAYFASKNAPAIVQRFHPGPCECGILWARCPAQRDAVDGRAGFIFSITRKEFPVLVGDGVRPLEDLVCTHPRFRYQAGVFIERFAGDRRRVLASGETLRLAQSGNHCQGTLFRDGADLITPALEARIDEIARAFGPPGAAGGLDIGRFDVRYESDDSLRRGELFAIVELNGTTGESTNIYDPARSSLWAYRVLARQWSLLYELGARRRDAGHAPLTLLGLLRAARAHYATRSGSALAD